jgi:hypothetical protein
MRGKSITPSSGLHPPRAADRASRREPRDAKELGGHVARVCQNADAMPALAQPVVRGFLCKMMLESIRKLAAEQQHKVFALIPESVIALIESSPKLGWVPHEDSLKVLDALHRVLGDPHFRRYLSRLAEEMMDYPMLHSFFDGAIRLFGLTPQALLKWSPYAWEQVFRDSGVLVYRPLRESASGGKIEMELEKCPPALLRSGSLAEVLAGAFEMFLRRASTKGRVELLLLDKDQGRARYSVTWE